MSNQELPEELTDAILKETTLEDVKDESIKKCIKQDEVVKGYDFNKGLNYDDFFKSFATTGFQATNINKSIKIIRKMLEARLPDSKETKEKGKPLKLYLGYTSNMISSGVRETIRFICEHKMVDYIVTTCGGIEEDLMKCLADTYVGRFDFNGQKLRNNGINRIGNLLVPNDNYCKFEKWIKPIFDKMVKEQNEDKVVWTPSKMIERFGKEINHKDSVLYWCYKNKIPIFCPAITDGSVGDMLFFYNFDEHKLNLDVSRDIVRINKSTLYEKNTGQLILGGGVVKHHILNANLMRNGADYTVLINTGQEYDGSDAGAKPEESISWGKIALNGEHCKVYGDASFIFPIVASQSFVKFYYEQKAKEEKKKEEK